jgi:hypothetical protein
MEDECDEHACTARCAALPWIHGEVGAALRAAAGFSLFMPVQGVRAAEAVIRRAAVLADGSIFTQLLPSEASISTAIA